MARFISVVRQSIGSGSGSVTPVITGATNSSGVPANTYGVLLVFWRLHRYSQNVTFELVKSGATVTEALVKSGVVPNQSSLEF